MFIWQVRSSSLTIALERAKKGENKAFGPPGQVGFHARQANFLPPGCPMEVDVNKLHNSQFHNSVKSYGQAGF